MREFRKKNIQQQITNHGIAAAPGTAAAAVAAVAAAAVAAAVAGWVAVFTVAA